VILAQEAPAEEAVELFGWFLGLGIGFAVIVVVVVIVGAILSLADRIGDQAVLAAQALDDARVATLPLWDVHHVNEAARGVLTAARSARGLLEEAS
jgi:predicted RND superfamily exporter protein